jgi:hypothetical protein
MACVDVDSAEVQRGCRWRVARSHAAAVEHGGCARRAPRRVIVPVIWRPALGRL